MAHRVAQRGLRIVLAFCLLTLLLPIVAVRAQAALDVKISTIDVKPLPDEAVHEVSAIVSVVDAKGAPIKGLAASAFVVREDGQEVKLTKAEAAQARMEIVLVIDASGSMFEADSKGRLPIDEVRKAVKDLKDILGQDDELALITFGTTVNQRVDFTTDHNRVINEINAVKNEGWTCLYDAAYAGVEKAATKPLGRRAVMVFSDGVDETAGNKPCSTHTLDEVIKRASTQNIQVPIFTIGLDSGKLARNELKKMAADTGGRDVMTPDSAQLSALFRSIGEQLKSQYQLTYKSAAGKGPHQVTVKVTRDGTSADSQAKGFMVDKCVAVPKFVNLKEGDSLKDPLDVSLEIQANCALKSVQLFLDDKLVDSRGDVRSLRFALDTKALAPGAHTLRIAVTDADQTTVERSVKFTVVAQPVTPTPTRTPTPTPTATPEPGGIKVSGETTIRWPLVIVILLVALAAVGVLILLLLRRPLKPSPQPTAPWGAAQPAPAPQPRPADWITEMAPAARDDVTVDMGPVIATLTVQKSLKLESGHVFELAAQDYRVGRSADPRYQNDLIIPDEPVSREHALFSYRNGAFYLSDRGSRFGTLVNGEKVGPEGTLLHDGDEIQFGTRTVLTFKALPREEPEPVTEDVGGEGVTEDVAERASTDEIPGPQARAAEPEAPEVTEAPEESVFEETEDVGQREADESGDEFDETEDLSRPLGGQGDKTDE